MNRQNHIGATGKILPQRKSIRLSGYDYSSAGYYFVTICTQNRVRLFGEIVDGEMNLNDAGTMVQTIWHEIPQYYPDIEIDAFQIMPNHIHGIIRITDVGADSISARNTDSISARNTDSISARNTDSISARNPDERAEMDSAPTVTITITTTGLSTVVQSFKRNTTIKYINMVKTGIVPPFNKRIWQRNYWEHIVRNENELNRIRQYIKNNPKMWVNDKLNGGAGNMVMESATAYGEQQIWMV